jgi:hypothetical protein
MCLYARTCTRNICAYHLQIGSSLHATYTCNMHSFCTGMQASEREGIQRDTYIHTYMQRRARMSAIKAIEIISENAASMADLASDAERGTYMCAYMCACIFVHT